MNPFDQAWALIKMPKPDFPYYGDPEKFSINHTISEDGKQIDVAAHQGLDEYDMPPMRYGHASFMIRDEKLIPRTSYTHPSFRRGGISTDLYNHAEKVTGLPVVDDSPMQSPDASAFWANREDKQ